MLPLFFSPQHAVVAVECCIYNRLFLFLVLTPCVFHFIYASTIHPSSTDMHPHSYTAYAPPLHREYSGMTRVTCPLPFAEDDVVEAGGAAKCFPRQLMKAMV